MTLLWVDGFDLLGSADITTKWNGGLVQTGTNGGSTSISNVAANTPYGAGQSLISGWINFNTGSGSYIYTNIGFTRSTLICGFAYNVGTFGNDNPPILGFMDSTSTQCTLNINSTSNFLQVKRGATVLATGTTVIHINQWNYFEIQVTFATGATGSVAVHVNGVSDISASSVQTASTSNASANGVAIGQLAARFSIGTTNAIYDDLYVCDTSGGVNNTFLGPIRVIGLLPSGAGTNTNLTKGGSSPAATNWQSVNNLPEDNDITYVSSSVTTTYDTYAITDAPSSVSAILAVVASPVARRDDAGLRSLSTRVRSGGTEADSPTSIALTPTYLVQEMVMENNPVTSAPWVVTDFNAAEIGPKVL